MLEEKPPQVVYIEKQMRSAQKLEKFHNALNLEILPETKKAMNMKNMLSPTNAIAQISFEQQQNPKHQISFA